MVGGGSKGGGVAIRNGDWSWKAGEMGSWMCRGDTWGPEDRGGPILSRGRGMEVGERENEKYCSPARSRTVKSGLLGGRQEEGREALLLR